MPAAKSPESPMNELFRAEMVADGVTALANTPRADLSKPKPKPRATQRDADEARVPHDSLLDTAGWDGDVEMGDLIDFLRNGIARDVLRKLRRGQWVIQANLDLHGATTQQARVQLGEFLAHARHSGLRCIRIVHGRGTRSVGGIPVIRNKVRHSLSQRDDVLAFCDAAQSDGGAGAVLVLLKSS